MNVYHHKWNNNAPSPLYSAVKNTLGAAKGKLDRRKYHRRYVIAINSVNLMKVNSRL